MWDQRTRSLGWFPRRPLWHSQFRRRRPRGAALRRPGSISSTSEGRLAECGPFLTARAEASLGGDDNSRRLPGPGLPGAYPTNVLVKLGARKSLISMVGAHGLEPWTR